MDKSAHAALQSGTLFFDMFTFDKKLSQSQFFNSPFPYSSCRINIEYATSPDASGLQWIPPSATSGKKLNFLFSQFQVVVVVGI